MHGRPGQSGGGLGPAWAHLPSPPPPASCAGPPNTGLFRGRPPPALAPVRRQEALFVVLPQNPDSVLWDPGPSARGGAPTAGVWPGTLPSLGPCGPGAHRPAPARWVAGPALAPFRELTWPTPPLPRGFRTALGLVQSQRPGCQVSSFRAEGAKHRTGAASRGGLGLGGAPAPVPPSHSRVPCVCTTLRTSFPSLTSPAPTPGACTHPLTAAQSCRPHSVLCSGPG